MASPRAATLSRKVQVMEQRVPLPSQPRVEWELLKLLHLARSMPTAEVYRVLADHFVLDSEQRSRMIGEVVHENAWHNLCRQARRRLVDQGWVKRYPHAQWSITASGDRRMTITAEELGL